VVTINLDLFGFDAQTVSFQCKFWEILHCSQWIYLLLQITTRQTCMFLHNLDGFYPV